MKSKMAYDPQDDPYDDDPYDLRFVLGCEVIDLHLKYGPDSLTEDVVTSLYS